MESHLSYADQKIKVFVESTPTNHFLQYMSEQVTILVPYVYQPTNPSNKVVPPMSSFISLLAKRSRVKVGTLLSALIIMEKLKKKLDQTRSSVIRGLTLHNVFLGSIILTSKYLHDASPKNSRWARYAAYFTTEEINRLERKLLVAMDHHLKITEEELDNAINSYHHTVPTHLSSIPYTVYDKQYLPKSASLSSFIRPSNGKQSSLYSLVQQFKTSLAEFRKSPNSTPKSIRTSGSSKTAHSSKVFDASAATTFSSNSNNHMSEKGDATSVVQSWSLLDTAIPSGDLFIGLHEHISASSLTSNSTVDNDSLITLVAYSNNDKGQANVENNKGDGALSDSLADFSNSMSNDRYLRRAYEKDSNNNDRYIP
ncbi:hypothetical protein G6F57_000109 [Rhizopus arrhizus]|uniref:Cyclin N-terminal domain-containing protein n=1 Tax=Rhizopus oryzae TaxID=64495 RepID=A0A9P6XKX0_RHIOR|nr:hypothetical protein G6F23_000012 [Rhizopus arrhizus]KAG1428836.1 hypothetical protein G6F58_000373 [Rhizopus delemar]KAG0770497.1 hypothetical protein G6F24_000150 [Rhizopus arrhizus]KAG0797995.1 hypothetical protein G6F21_000086 [Rhizopus arrhizus]KAG0801965.1 hypothetical protein G6F22_000726 [Rhizopus arrhizus]